ncbi:hypothetical protein PRUPE_5G212300 [Prunus persica]|uniref:Uncharacterized protein n=1 Tax=Prunus persica TaxID=3760 RepID=A0A251PBR7_PRUPE|nr:hypothetical protein PRUPE_5G212300 [Prunus persica]
MLLILLLLWSTTPRVTDHRLRGSTSTSSSLSSSLALPQRTSTITGQVVQMLNEEIKLRNEELEAKDETIRKLREELEAN